MTRADIIQKVAGEIFKIDVSHPVRVAIDGRTASGKTTFAAEVAATIKGFGRTVISTTIDGFHNPKSVRYRRGRYSAEGYYRDARDLSAIRTLLLDPLGPDGDLSYRTASFDLQQDQAVQQPPRQADINAILVVDGTFLQRPELADAWDMVIFLDTSEAISEMRGVNRDSKALGGVDIATQLYAKRYKPAYALYLSECQPNSSADIEIDNNIFEYPVMRGCKQIGSHRTSKITK